MTLKRQMPAAGPFGLNGAEMRVLRALDTAAKIQDFLNDLPMNEELRGDTCLSPRRVLREGHAHCMEGALLAALALRLHGAPPLVMDLKSSRRDLDHVVALFKRNGRWGAISKTNHAVLRYREPVYTSPRELAMSYFHEYFLDTGEKTMRSFSAPFDLSQFDKKEWTTDENDVWYIPSALDRALHISVAPRHILKDSRRADDVEIAAGTIVEWKKGKKKRFRSRMV